MVVKMFLPRAEVEPRLFRRGHAPTEMRVAMQYVNYPYVTVVTRLRTGRPGFEAGQGQGTLLTATASRRALRPTQPPV